MTGYMQDIFEFPIFVIDMLKFHLLIQCLFYYKRNIHREHFLISHFNLIGEFNKVLSSFALEQQTTL